MHSQGKSHPRSNWALAGCQVLLLDFYQTAVICGWRSVRDAAMSPGTQTLAWILNVVHTACRHVPRLKFVRDHKTEEQEELDAVFERLSRDRQIAGVPEAA